MGADGLGYRFEKSLYDLIRGLRNHKGNEKEYIQKTLKECRAEVRSQDMGWSISHTAMTATMLMCSPFLRFRPQGYGSSQAHIPGNVWTRHVMGLLSCP